MTRTSAPGNERDRGFALPDALLCLFIAGVILLALQGASASLGRISAGVAAAGHALIRERNALELEKTAMTGTDHDSGSAYQTERNGADHETP
jgi:Tfp pilus assembly protein PilV